MKVERLALYVLAVLAAAGWGAAAWHSRQSDELRSADAVRVLSSAGWREGRTHRAPELALPAGADHVASARIRVEYRDRVVEVPGGDHVEYLPTVCPEGTWELSAGDLGADLRLDVAEVSDRPFALLSGRITARTPVGEVAREIDPQERELDLDLWVRRSSLDEPVRFGLGFRRPRHWRTGWVVGAGLTYEAPGQVAPGLFVGYGVQF